MLSTPSHGSYVGRKHAISSVLHQTRDASPRSLVRCTHSSGHDEAHIGEYCSYPAVSHSFRIAWMTKNLCASSGESCITCSVQLSTLLLTLVSFIISHNPVRWAEKGATIVVSGRILPVRALSRTADGRMTLQILHRTQDSTVRSCCGSLKFTS